MSAAIFALMVNAVLALMLAASFATLQQRTGSSFWRCAFGLSFLVGSLAPLCGIIVRIGFPHPVVILLGYAAFLGSLLLLARAFSRYYGIGLHPWLLPSIFVAGVAMRVMILVTAPTGFLYEFGYQAPFAAALVSGLVVLVRVRRKQGSEQVLITLLLMAAVHFIAKAGIASAFGIGGHALAARSVEHALLVQSATAVLLVAVGLAMITIIIRDALASASHTADTDALSGLLNRRGFDAAADRALSRSTAFCAVMCDLDHFKVINDEFGHGVGDEIIRDFSRLVLETAPTGSLIGRTGGEEFSILVPGDEEAGLAFAHALKSAQQAASSAILGRPATVSIGVAAVESPSLAAAMREADRALYVAKAAGRNTVRRAGRARDAMPAAPMIHA